MAEDSGAFKTNPPNSAQFGQFVKARQHRCNEAAPVKETFFPDASGPGAGDF
jgi:hypothetical protein